MNSNPTPRAVTWFHPEFDLGSLFTAWCRTSAHPAFPDGVWQTRWIPSSQTPPSESELFGGPVPGGIHNHLRVARHSRAEMLRSQGYAKVTAMGLPAVYLPDPETPRIPQSLLLLLSPDPAQLASLTALVAASVSPFLPLGKLLQRIVVCLPPHLHAAAAESLSDLRHQGVEFLPFEENLLCAASLREAARLFSEATFVSGNRPGHWLPHAAFRGARVSLLPPLPGDPTHTTEGLPSWLFRPPLQAECARSWGAAELGISERLSPKALAASCHWPAPDSDSTPLPIGPEIPFSVQCAPHRLLLELHARPNLEREIAAYKRLQEAHPQNPHFALVLALLKAGGKAPQEAVALLQRALDACPDHPLLAHTLAELLLSAGRISDAARLSQIAVQKAPRQPQAYLQLGRLLEAAGHSDLATELLSQGLALAHEAPPEILWPGSTGSSLHGKTLLVSCSSKPASAAEGLLLVRSFRQNFGHPNSGVDLDLTFENRLGLPEVYNAKLEAAAHAGYRFAVFVHDDVFIDDPQLTLKLERAHKKHGFHLIGVAGGSQPAIVYPSLWHLMCPRDQLRGAAGHFEAEQRTQTSVCFGPSPSTVELLDGLFLGVHLPSAMAVGWRFDTQFRFHHYDLVASLDAKRKGMTAGVFPIHLIHASPGLRSLDDPEWSRSDALFRHRFGSPPTAHAPEGGPVPPNDPA